MIKQLCLELEQRKRSDDGRYASVFDSIHGAVFYATPHMGSWFGNRLECLLGCLPCFTKSSVLPLLRILSDDTAAINRASETMRDPAGQRLFWTRAMVETSSSSSSSSSSNRAPAAAGSGSWRQQGPAALASVPQFKVVSVDVSFVRDSWYDDSAAAHLHCIIESTDSSSSCVLRGTNPKKSGFYLNGKSWGFRSGMSLTADTGPAGPGSAVEVLSLPAAVLDTMVRGVCGSSQAGLVTVPGATQSFRVELQPTRNVLVWLKWAWTVRVESIDSKVKLSMVEVGVGGSSCKWQREP
uniref:Uncharacterized protein n=1 Tax=Tetradesmus obliquus TaxID=3088 RepID=A0A383VP34_TETOB|eukprot:jgi/Sobl393_1/12092/SZX66579.1